MLIDTPQPEPVRTPQVQPKPGKVSPGAPHVGELLDYWREQTKPKPKTLHEAETVVKRFKDANGDIPLSQVTKGHVLTLRDLLTQGRAQATVKKNLGLLGAMFQLAIDDERFGLTVNPTRGVRLAGDAGEARLHFTAEDLNLILSSPIYTANARPTGCAGDAGWWIPVIAIYTGARVNEIGQLRLDDVRETEGVLHFRLTNEGEGQSIKTGARGRRHVPVHDDLLKLGLLRYVAHQRKAGHSVLFPDLKPDNKGHLTGNFSKWFSRWLRGTIGIKDPRKTLHSTRHTWKRTARACGIPEPQHDAMSGHANRSVAREYGNAEGYPLGPLQESIRALRFTGLKLPAPWEPPSASPLRPSEPAARQPASR